MKWVKGKRATRVFQVFRMSNGGAQRLDLWCSPADCGGRACMVLCWIIFVVYVTKWSRTNTESTVASVCTAGSWGLYFFVDGGWTTINPCRQTATQTVRPPFPRPFLFPEWLWRWTYCTHTLYPCCASTRRACVRVESWRNVPRNHLITESWLSPFFFFFNTLTSPRHTWHDPSQDSLGHTKHFSWEPV